ncbi:MAG: hypothetical protein IKE89_02455 [Bacilli bacterium]|nr:hypothetical protein [Bacilli bacterium]
MKTNKSTHTIISYILLLTTIITIIYGIIKKINKLYYSRNYYDTNKYIFISIK